MYAYYQNIANIGFITIKLTKFNFNLANFIAFICFLNPEILSTVFKLDIPSAF